MEIKLQIRNFIKIYSTVIQIKSRKTNRLYTDVPTDYAVCKIKLFGLETTKVIWDRDVSVHLLSAVKLEHVQIKRPYNNFVVTIEVGEIQTPNLIDRIQP